MGHSVDIPYLNNELINKYFESLAGYILQAGIGEHVIFVVGGAAMALKYTDGKSTVDIDILFKEQNNLYCCCERVREEFDLPDDWINADVMRSESFSYKLFENAVLYKTYKDILKVFIVSDIDLYCMKIIPFRPKDIQDMATIAATLKKDKMGIDDVKKNFIRLYGDLYLFKNDPRKERLVGLQLR